jgi:hypothetical protein
LRFARQAARKVAVVTSTSKRVGRVGRRKSSEAHKLRSPCVVLPALSAVDTDVQRNVQLLKDRSWFDIPIVYTNGGRAILAMEKGSPGDHAFTEAFAAWSRG